MKKNSDLPISFLIFGKNGIRILTQILGFFILAISIQLLTDGIFAVLEQSGWS
ncbi:MAG: hypothetical protein QNJ70_16345 [Xenococcaceae cyanobacterium MO_207.B15]|nr:hypothetical protein [Xenococcaceae cyanobacterium MO_207.B15]MDJ0743467.1 hypothetical protein [Xenococcaceae cyanobacterium MO_167.B27]